MKVEVAELEDLLGPDDVNVDFRRILEEARDENGCAIFTTLSTDGRVERNLETKIRRLLQVMDGGGTAEGWMEFGGKRGYGGSGRVLGELIQRESGR